MAEQYSTLDINRSAGVAQLTLGGSNDLNALDQQTADELLAATVDLSEDDSVRCIVLTGAGDTFGVGADLTTLSGDDEDAAPVRRLASTLHDAIVQLHHAEKPVLTAVNGIAAGAGFSLALVGDVVVAHEDARFDYAYGRVGLTGDGGSTFYLPRLVGLRKAKEIVLLDEAIDAADAVGLGIVTEAVSADDFEDRVEELASRLADGPTKAFGMTKKLMTESFEHDLPAQLAAETEAMARATRTEDYSRGHAAFLGKEEPDFIGK